MLAKNDSVREAWQREFFSHFPEYAAEFAGTAFLMFCVVGAVAYMFAPASPVPGLISSVRLRLLVTGLLLGGAGSLVAVTPLGRISGAHLNPAISLGFFAEGKMQWHDLLAYIVAQVAGAALGAWLGASVFGHLAATVSEALNQPGRHVSAPMAFGAEVLATFALASVVFGMLSHKRWMRWTPLVVIGVVAVLVWADGNFSGASLNPARSFGPALVEHDWRLYWIYVLGPCCGGILAGILHRLGTPWSARTGKLFHDLHYRSIFTGRSDKAANIHVRRHASMPRGARPPVHKEPAGH